MGGVAALVVYAGADIVNKLFLLALHIILHKKAAAGGGGDKHFPKKPGNAFKKLLPIGSEAVGNEARIKAKSEDLALLADNGEDTRPVKLVAGCGNGVHIGVEGSAAAEHAGNESVEGNGLSFKLGEQAEAQTVGLELVCLQAAEPYSGKYFFSFNIQNGYPL